MYNVLFFDFDQTFDVLKQRGKHDNVGDIVIVNKYSGQIIGQFGRHYILSIKI